MAGENQPVAETVSLWIVPERERRFVALIDSLSRAWGTPGFAPHVTLLGGIEAGEAEVRQRAAQLARDLEPIELRLGEIDWADEFFRAFYVAVEKRPALLRAHAAAAAAFGMSPETDYFPHLSLAYGELDDEPRRQAREGLGAGFGTCWGERLEVVTTAGPPENWETVGSYPLSRPQPSASDSR